MNDMQFSKTKYHTFWAHLAQLDAKNKKKMIGSMRTFVTDGWADRQTYEADI